jgi:hypothetical protein
MTTHAHTNAGRPPGIGATRRARAGFLPRVFCAAIG